MKKDNHIPDSLFSPEPENHIYFLGIGGIGMSALARYFRLRGLKVSGYDKTPSIVTDALESEGINVFFEPDINHLETVTAMIYTPAIKNHPEFAEAESRGIPVMKRSEALGIISKGYRTLGVAGTHGKTTTSSMLAWLMKGCGLEPTAFLGGISRNLNGNFAFGNSGFCVVEADEFDRSFLRLSPEMAAITSIDADHLDIYGTEEEVKNSYREFAALVTGFLLIHEDAKGFDWGREFSTYGIESGEYRAANIRFDRLGTFFDYQSAEVVIPNIFLPIPGKHNVLNATAAITLTLKAGGDMTKVKETLEGFKGIYRRFEVIHHSETLSLVDDYAHHPTELEAAVQTAKSLFPERQLITVFQPHLFSRTRDFYQGFAEALSTSDAVILLPVYPAREEPIPGVNAEMILNEMGAVLKSVCTKEHLIATLKEYISVPAVILMAGAGDIDREVEKVKNFIINY
ncbi:MAG: UDP-N-acetylmuramate--L-alanine ligase [Bacteroidia bacterium]|nr:UDP-N-acetylmuramate--L-alanine ligase [Bacteroidia bacterium]